MTEVWDFTYNEEVILTLYDGTCSVCKTQVQAGEYRARASDYCMISVNGESVIARSFPLISSPCQCATCVCNKWSKDLTQFAEGISGKIIEHYQARAFDAEKLPFPYNLDAMEANKKMACQAKTKSLAWIMNHYAIIKDYIT